MGQIRPKLMEVEDESFRRLPWQRTKCSDGRTCFLLQWQQLNMKTTRTTSKEKLEQYTERTQPYNDLVLTRTWTLRLYNNQNPKYQKEFDNQEQV